MCDTNDPWKPIFSFRTSTFMIYLETIWRHSFLVPSASFVAPLPLLIPFGLLLKGLRRNGFRDKGALSSLFNVVDYFWIPRSFLTSTFFALIIYANTPLSLRISKWMNAFCLSSGGRLRISTVPIHLVRSFLIAAFLPQYVPHLSARILHTNDFK
jgi:hypothetical protein